MYFWNKIAITFKDGKTSICDKILFKQIGNWSIEYYSTGNILPTENATFESGSFLLQGHPRHTSDSLCASTHHRFVSKPAIRVPRQ